MWHFPIGAPEDLFALHAPIFELNRKTEDTAEQKRHVVHITDI